MGNKLGKMIDHYRKKDGYTLMELGRRLNKSSSAVSRWISGDRSPMVDDLIRLTELFDVDVETLLYGRQVQSQSHHYTFYDRTVITDTPIDPDKPHDITLSDCVMGQHAGDPDVMIMKVTTDTLDITIPTQSLIAVKKTPIHELRDGDMVVLYANDELSLTRFYNDPDQSRFIFRPQSTNPMHTDQSISYDAVDQIKNIGKIVVTISQFD